MSLRPVTEADLDELDRMWADPDALGVYNWGGFSDASVWRKRWQENRLLADDKSVLMIDFGAETIGFVSWNRVVTGPAAYAYEFGISLWPSARGKGHGTAAQLMLARYLFDNAPVNRIQAITDFDNVAEQRALEKAGFTREAVLKGLAFRAGEWRDEVMYRMLRSELPTPGGAATPAG
jgi:RimJ/RimL family protein N-acetyltransferase